MLCCDVYVGGTPAAGIRVNLHANVNPEAVNDGFQWERVGEAVTNEDGRGSGLIPADMKVSAVQQ